jgi:hypothetical protein
MQRTIISPALGSTRFEMESCPMFALATVEYQGQALGCLELDGRYFPLSSLAKQAGLADLPASVIDLVADWVTYGAQLPALLPHCQPANGLAPDQVRVLAPLLYPGKILCAGANYFDHLAEMGMPGAKKEEQRLFFFM